MLLNAARARQLLAKGDLRTLFVEELGWDRHPAMLDVNVNSERYTLEALAHKRGMVVYRCPTAAGQRLPDHATRRKIEREVAKSTHEHLIVFTDANNETQTWQWVKHELGKPAACREHTYHRSQPGDALLQKLGAIAFTLDEEDRLSLPDVTRRARAGFDVEQVTKRFYERFQKEHGAFLKFITGIIERVDREWYASVMLNRLMFVYFMQRKGFLDGDNNYLRNRLDRMRAEHGKDKFYSFYRYFLLRLFHEGLGGRQRTSELEKLVGRIPYLNGGLFDVHELEKPDRHGKDIQIPDKAFERIFDFFDQYQWHLDERPLRNNYEINPDVLGYIFEKYINQKQMGAYYTQEDITEYISKSTLLPYLLKATSEKCRIAFEGSSNTTVWDLLNKDPDRYIHAAVRHGTALPLPHDIAAGLATSGPQQPTNGNSEQLLSVRRAWNRIAPAEYGLPAESWREVISRRQQYQVAKHRLTDGHVRNIVDLLALNLDIRQFVQDAIENCEEPDVLRAFWSVIQDIRILDPTCGSGAFLFAALNVLEPLYEACLDRMAAFLAEIDQTVRTSEKEHFSDFREALEVLATHPNRRYFILKSIVLNNLYGVDIMKEAGEICKLRLFLKLAAQVEPDAAHSNLGIEPLPDIDFNIRVGNTLVGYAGYHEMKAVSVGRLDFDNAMPRIEAKAAELQRAFDAFRRLQVDESKNRASSNKTELREHLKALDNELNHYLAVEYGVSSSKRSAFDKWSRSHQPFHWLVEFHDIMHRGGFDVIIGNPPYVELSDVVEQYQIRDLNLLSTGNLYALCLERFSGLLRPGGWMGVIVPISAISTPRMLPLMQLLAQRFSLFVSNYAVRPGKLFVGVDMNLSILIGERKEDAKGICLMSTRYMRWTEHTRPYLFRLLTYAPTQLAKDAASIPKIGSALERRILEKVARHPRLNAIETTVGGETVYYHSGGRYFRKCIRRQLSNEYKELRVADGYADLVVCLMSSSFYYWLWILFSDCYHVTRRDVELIPVPSTLARDPRLKQLSQRLLDDLERHASRRVRQRADGSRREEVNYHVGKSMAIVDEIDRILAPHYQLSAEELDFIMSSDIKYRAFGEENGE